MEIYKEGVCHELQNLLIALDEITKNPGAKVEYAKVEKLRRKIIKLCNILDAIEKNEVVR